MAYMKKKFSLFLYIIVNVETYIVIKGCNEKKKKDKRENTVQQIFFWKCSESQISLFSHPPPLCNLIFENGGDA